MDIVVWLRSLGLGKYEAAFRENEIDETVLPSLTHETLKELGVTAVGHRLQTARCYRRSAEPKVARKPRHQRPHPRGHRLRRQVQHPSQKLRANAAISR